MNIVFICSLNGNIWATAKAAQMYLWSKLCYLVTELNANGESLRPQRVLHLQLFSQKHLRIPYQINPAGDVLCILVEPENVVPCLLCATDWPVIEVKAKINGFGIF